ncbi:MAG: hypothetical protein ACPL1D_01285 [Microgenomates group bacterium]
MRILKIKIKKDTILKVIIIFSSLILIISSLAIPFVYILRR